LNNSDLKLQDTVESSLSVTKMMKRAKTSKFDFEILYVKKFLFTGIHKSFDVDSNPERLLFF